MGVVLSITVCFQNFQGAMACKTFRNLIILGFERWYPKENTIASLKSKILPSTNFLAPPKFWAGYKVSLSDDWFEIVRHFSEKRKFQTWLCILSSKRFAP